MPVYMDRHILQEGTSMEDIRQLQSRDLSIQAAYGCTEIGRWWDEPLHTAYCLIKAPDEMSIRAMHLKAHGVVPDRVVAVDAGEMVSVTGFTGHSTVSGEGRKSAIHHPASRVILFVSTGNPLAQQTSGQLSVFRQKFHNSVTKTIKHYKGSIIKNDNNTYRAAFISATDAIQCALKLHADIKYITPKFDALNRSLNIGISYGPPVTEQKGIYGEAIREAERMCRIVSGDLVVSSNVRHCYNRENRHAVLDRSLIRILRPGDEHFIARLDDAVGILLDKNTLSIHDLGNQLDLNPSQLYRRVRQLTGKSLNTYLREARLLCALRLLNIRFGRISEIAAVSGFSSFSYFSRCFNQMFGMLPSRYARYISS